MAVHWSRQLGGGGGFSGGGLGGGGVVAKGKAPKVPKENFYSVSRDAGGPTLALVKATSAEMVGLMQGVSLVGHHGNHYYRHGTVGEAAAKLYEMASANGAKTMIWAINKATRPKLIRSN